MTTRSFVGMICGALGLFSVSGTFAAVIVNFNSEDYTSSNFAHMNGYTNGVAGVPYSEDTLRNPTSNYNQALPSALFYGGAITDGADGLTTYRVSNNTGGDRISVASSSLGATVTQIVVWQQEDFLAFSSGDVGLNTTSSISFSLRSGASGRSAAARILIQQAGSYYVSEVVGTISGTSANNISILDPTALDWFNYNPLSSLTVIGSEAALPDLDGLTAVGLWAQGTSTVSASASVSVDGITFNAVPEPGVGMLFGMGTAVLLLIRRRRSMI